jgi:8-oxo-dGTP pyrophosphatase MutT (NUDIX family)
VTLLVDFGDRIAIVSDQRSGLWFLPGGGVEQNESIEEAAKREAVEELGLEVNTSQVVATFNVTLVSKGTRERVKIPPFIVVHATPAGGRLRRKYARNRKILLVRKNEFNAFPQNSQVPVEYEWMMPYFRVSRAVVQEFLK